MRMFWSFGVRLKKKLVVGGRMGVFSGFESNTIFNKSK